MPYALTFHLQAAVQDPDKYINDCCVGGDIVLDKIEPTMKKMYTAVEANQEDWGWFAWMEKDSVKLAVDIFNEDTESMSFRVHITGRRSRWVLPDKVEDTAELEELKTMVVSLLQELPVQALAIERVDSKYMPLPSAA
jgi:hypothetical protein